MKSHELYEIRDGKVERLRRTCDRCGDGYFMGEHIDRYVCGNCGNTVSKESSKGKAKAKAKAKGKAKAKAKGKAKAKAKAKAED